MCRQQQRVLAGDEIFGRSPAGNLVDSPNSKGGIAESANRPSSIAGPARQGAGRAIPRNKPGTEDEKQSRVSRTPVDATCRSRRRAEERANLKSSGNRRSDRISLAEQTKPAPKPLGNEGPRARTFERQHESKRRHLKDAGRKSSEQRRSFRTSAAAETQAPAGDNSAVT